MSDRPPVEPEVRAYNSGSDLHMVRRITRESINLLGGGRATLMQIAHPLIAAGVWDHSQFRQDPLARLQRTTDLMMALVFGSKPQVAQAVQRFNTVHHWVHGELASSQGRFPSGTAYTAHDPQLKFWVQATLVDTSLLVFERFVARLSVDERERYYAESKTVGEWLGIPRSLYPRDLDAFAAYMRDMLHGDTLAVTPRTLELAHAVLFPSATFIPRASACLLRFATAGLLPDNLRQAFGFTWSPIRQRILDGLSLTYRYCRPITPGAIALMPQSGGGALIRWAILQTHAK